jgi:protease IV
MMDENSETREIPINGTPWEQPGASNVPDSNWVTPPQAQLIPQAVAPQPPAPPPAKKRSIFKTLMLIASLGGLAIFLLSMTLTMLTVRGFSNPAQGMGAFDVHIEHQGTGEEKIALLSAEGVLMGSDGAGPDLLTQLKHLNKKAQDMRLKAIILKIDSPGGAVGICDEIDAVVKKIRKKGIKVVSFYRGLAASGGYYISARSDHIIARPTCLIGSIGVISQAINAGKLLEEKLGLQVQILKSVPYKDVPSMFRSMTTEEAAYMQAIIDSLHQRFLSIVTEGRGLTPEKVALFANGKIFLAKQALALGMIDQIGEINDATDFALKNYSPQATIFSYRRRGNPMSQIFGIRNDSPIPEQLRMRLELASRNRACYLWAP